MKKKMLMWGLVVIEMEGVFCTTRLNKSATECGSDRFACINGWCVCTAL
jgi:hypothetical protein